MGSFLQDLQHTSGKSCQHSCGPLGSRGSEPGLPAFLSQLPGSPGEHHWATFLTPWNLSFRTCIRRKKQQHLCNGALWGLSEATCAEGQAPSHAQSERSINLGLVSLSRLKKDFRFLINIFNLQSSPPQNTPCVLLKIMCYFQTNLRQINFRFHL